MYYAEFGTDKFISELFPSDYIGVIVEVGAGPPVFISTSKHFRERGWRSICVEPNPKFAQQHLEDGSEVYQYACADFEGKRSFVINLNNDHWYDEKTDGVSFSSLGIRLPGVPQHNTQSSIEVDVVRLDTLLRMAKVHKVDVLSVDTEGWELDVLRGFSHWVYQPKIIVLENLNKDPHYDSHMRCIGYKVVAELGHNTVYLGL